MMLAGSRNIVGLFRGLCSLPPALQQFKRPDYAAQFEEAGITAGAAARSLERFIKEERQERIAHVAARRQPQMACVLEGLYDLGNVSAVMRSAEAFGIEDIYLINQHNDRFKVSRSISVGAEKWLRLRHFTNTRDCISHLHAQGYHVTAAHCPSVEPAEHDANCSDGAGEAVEPDVGTTLTELDLTSKTAVIFGNEFAGMTDEALELADSTFFIDIGGFAQSLNVSAAAAIVFHHAAMQVKAAGPQPPAAVERTVCEYYARSLASKGWTFDHMLSAVDH